MMKLLLLTFALTALLIMGITPANAQPLSVNFTFSGQPYQGSYTFNSKGPFSTETDIRWLCATWNYAWSVTPSTGVVISNPSAEKPTITFASAGNYSVKLTVSTHSAPGWTCGSDVKSVTKTVTINLPPVAKFKTNGADVSAVTVNPNSTVGFTDYSENIPTSWNWTVSPSSGWAYASGGAASQHPSIVFTSQGSYTVSLKATNNTGTHTVTKTNHVNVVQAAPVAKFNASSLFPIQGTTVSFTDASSNNPTAWSWSISPTTGWSYSSGGATTQNNQVLFSTPARYTVSLNTSNSGGSSTTTGYVTVTPPPPTVNSYLIYCQGAPASVLTATGSDLRWYTSASGGTASSSAPTPSTATVGTTAYYVTQTVNSIESPRAQITITVKETPLAPSVITPVKYCPGVTPSPLSATGVNLKWYTIPTGGTASSSAPTPSTSASGTTYYYVSQTSNQGCESQRAQIAVIVDANLPAPTVTSPVTYCMNAAAAPLTAIGTALLWYTAPTGGVGTANAPTPSTASSGTTSYYVTQSSPGCNESPRAKLNVDVSTTPVPPAPAVNSPVTYLFGDTAIALSASGNNLRWYTTANGGTPVTAPPTPSTSTAGTVSYYVSQVVSGCEGARSKIDVIVRPLPPPPAWELTKKIGSVAAGYGRDIATDPQGNVYVTGIGSPATIVTKYSAAGEVVWTLGVSDMNTYSTSVAVDELGNSYVSGIHFGTVTIGNTTLTSNYSNLPHFFLLKLNTAGQVVWARRTNEAAYTYAIAVDKEGNSYLTGHFANTVEFGNSSLTSSGGHDIYLVKYNPAGDVVWARKEGTSANEYAYSLALDSAGNSYITGKTAVGAGFYVAKYDAGGNKRWLKQIEKVGSSTAAGYGIAASGNGSIYVTGEFKGTISFGTAGSLTSHSTTYNSIFVVKLDSAGKLLWSQKSGGATGDGSGKSISLDKFQNVYVTGSFAGTANFGRLPLTTESALVNHLFVAKYNEHGSIAWAKQTTGNGKASGNTITTDVHGGTFITGQISGTEVIFDSTTVATSNVTSKFLAKTDFGAPVIIMAPLDRTSFTLGDTLLVRFNSLGKFNDGNQFQVQLSDADGSFASPVELGSGAGSPIVATIPSAATACSKYRIRVVSTKPGAVGNDNGTNLIINSPDALKAPGKTLMKQIPQHSGGELAGRKIVTDAAGNSFISGSFYGSIRFDSITLSTASTGVFLVKYNATQKVEWASIVATASGYEGPQISSLAIDKNGNLLITGDFYTSLSTGQKTMASQGETDIFIAKCNPTGQTVWMQRIGSERHEYCKGITVDSTGSLYVTGVKNTYSYNGYNQDSIIVSKLDPQGEIRWINKYAGIESYAIAAEPSGNVYVVGRGDHQVVKYNTHGQVVWARDFSDGGSITDILAIGANNLFIAGNFMDTVTIGSIGLRSLNYSSDAFVARLDTSGNAIWAHHGGGSEADRSYGLVADNCSNVYLTGTYQGEAKFGTTTLHNNHSDADIFVSKYDVLGNHLWAKSAGDSLTDHTTGIGIDGVGNCYLRAYITGPSAYGGTLSNPFLIKLSYDADNGCMVNGHPSTTWNGNVSSYWENGYNWSCNGKAPDADTDVIINSGNVILSTSTTVRSLTVSPGASLTVKPGCTLTVTNQ